MYWVKYELCTLQVGKITIFDQISNPVNPCNFGQRSDNRRGSDTLSVNHFLVRFHPVISRKMQALVESDLFKADKKTIDTQKVVFKIWENRNNIDVVKELADLLR